MGFLSLFQAFEFVINKLLIIKIINGRITSQPSTNITQEEPPFYVSTFHFENKLTEHPSGLCQYINECNNYS